MDHMFKKKFKAAKCKTTLKLLVSRIKIVRSKHEIQLKILRADVIQLLQKGQEDSALIRVENLIREQNMMDVSSVIETYCELLVSRMSIIDSQKVCPEDLHEAVSGLLYAGPRCAELPELLKVRELFVRKYGHNFVTAAMELHHGCRVSKKVTEKLSGRSASLELKENLLKKIAQENGFKWEPSTQEPGSLKSSDNVPVSYSTGDHRGSSLSSADAIAETQPVRSSKPSNSVTNPVVQSSASPAVASNSPAAAADGDRSTISRSSSSSNPKTPDKLPSVSSAARNEALDDRQSGPFERDGAKERQDTPLNEKVSYSIGETKRRSSQSYVKADMASSPLAAARAEALSERQFVPFVGMGIGNTYPKISESDVIGDSKRGPLQPSAKADERQFVPFVRIDNGKTQKDVGQQDEKSEVFRSSSGSYFEAVATAAEAAAMSAENAAEAARAAARLARSGLSQKDISANSENLGLDHIKFAKIVPIQDKPQKASFNKGFDEKDVEINDDKGRLWQTSPECQTSMEKNKMKKTSENHSEDDASSYYENSRDYSRGPFDQTSTDGGEESEHDELHVIDVKTKGRNSWSPKKPMSEEYKYQGNSGEKADFYVASDEGSLHKNASLTHDDGYIGRKHSKAQDSWQDAAKFPESEDDMFSPKGEPEKYPPDDHQMQGLDSEISRPIFDEDFLHKTAVQMEGFYRTKDEMSQETLGEDDNDEVPWWNRKTADRIFKQNDEPSSPRINSIVPQRGSDIPLYYQNTSTDESGTFSPPSRSSYTHNLKSAPNYNMADDERRESNSLALGTRKSGTSAEDSDDSEKSYISSGTTFAKPLDSKPADDGNMTDRSDTAFRRTYNISGKPRIGASVRSRRTR